MLLNIISLLIFIISIIIISFIIIRRFPQIKSINTDIATREVEERQKMGLLEQRLDRKIKDIVKKNKKGNFLANFIEKIENSIKRNQISQKIYAFSKNKKNSKENIQKFFNEIDENIKNNDLINAENICFALLKYEKDNINILEKLSSIYLLKNDVQRTRETYEYIITILKRNKNRNTNKEMLQKISKYKIKIAEFYFNDKNYKKTVDILNELILKDENNPKIIDLLIESNINLKNRFVAEKLLDKMVEINSENLKIEEFQEKIDNMFK